MDPQDLFSQLFGGGGGFFGGGGEPFIESKPMLTPLRRTQRRTSPW